MERAEERQCSAVQIFCGNPRAWKMAARTKEDVRAFRENRHTADLLPLVVHACYLINPCSPDPNVYRKTVQRLGDELALSDKIGAEYYILHPGSPKDKPSEWAVDRLSQAIVAATEQADYEGTLLLENTAGHYGPGGSFETMADAMGRIRKGRPEQKLGLGLDSCHAHANGYNLTDPDEVEEMVDDIDSQIGLHALHLIHANDARDEPGTGRDRHTHIGEGTIGSEGFRNLLLHPQLNDLPLILETPWESVEKDRENLRRIRRIITSGPAPS